MLITAKRKILQKGGFLGLLLGPVISLLAPVVKPLAKRLLGGNGKRQWVDPISITSIN